LITYRNKFLKCDPIINVVGYILILRLNEDKRIKVGSLGEVSFKKGYYMYVGSAKNSIKRIERHFKSKKRLRWHIDYLSTNSEVLDAMLFHIEECELANTLSKHFEKIKNFGCSDCKCYSHLFYSTNNPVNKLKGLFKELTSFTSRRM